MTHPVFPLRAVAGQAKRPDLGEFLQLVVMNAFGHERWALARAHAGFQSGSWNVWVACADSIFRDLVRAYQPSLPVLFSVIR